MNRALAARLEGLRNAAGRDPRVVRQEVLALLCDRAGANHGAWYSACLVGGAAQPREWVVHGSLDVGALLTRRRDENLSVRDLRTPRLAWTRSFHDLRSSVGDERRWYESDYYRHIHAPANIDDQAALLVYSGERFVGWIGVLRRTWEGRFARADFRRLRPIVDVVASALITADATERSRVPEEGADCLLLTADGKVDLASVAAQRWLATNDAHGRLRSWARAMDRGREVPRFASGAELRWSRLLGATGSRYLVHLAPPHPVTMRRAARLSPTQLRVAELAAVGATVPEIARNLGRGVETVRTHLRAVYTTLGVASRLELARVLAASD